MQSPVNRVFADPVNIATCIFCKSSPRCDHRRDFRVGHNGAPAMLNPPPAKPVKAWEMILIIVLGVPGIWLAIQVYFGSMPILEAVGRFICHHLFGL